MKPMRMTWMAALACMLACHDGSHSTGGSAQGQSHWLESCEGENDCGDLACICGVCIAACDDDGGCSVEGRATRCESRDATGSRALCGSPAPRPICLETCGDGCPNDQRCEGGVCVPAESTEPSREDGGGAVRPPDAGRSDAGVDSQVDAAVDSGASDAAVPPEQDAAVSPLDCMAFPTFDRSCDDVSDCVVGMRQVNCCGSLVMTGLNASELASFQMAAGTCSSQFPLCGCAPSPTLADDGSTTDPGGSMQPTVECIDGTCRTTFLKGPTPCGPNLNCDAATEICVTHQPVGPSVQWSCEPVPAGCELQRTCECAGAMLCTGAFDQCFNTQGANEIDCLCPACQ